MNKIAYLEGYLEKQATYEGVVSEQMSGLVDNLLTGGLAAPVGAIAAAVSEGETPDNIAKKDKESGVAGVIPGVGTYRRWKRIGSTTRDEKGRPLPGAKASMLADVLGRYSPLALVGAPFGAIAAAITDRRSIEEQRQHDRDDMKNILMNILVPGVAEYNYWKRVGSTTNEPVKKNKKKSSKKEK